MPQYYVTSSHLNTPLDDDLCIRGDRVTNENEFFETRIEFHVHVDLKNGHVKSYTRITKCADKMLVGQQGWLSIDDYHPILKECGWFPCLPDDLYMDMMLGRDDAVDIPDLVHMVAL